MVYSLANSLASYVPWLRRSDDQLRLRIVLHDFGLVWEQAPVDDRLALVAAEPDPVDERWDAFVAAYVQHRCWHDDLEAPDWVFEERRYLDAFWFPGPRLESFRVEAVVHSPAAFEDHGVLLPVRELLVV